MGEAIITDFFESQLLHAAMATLASAPLTGAILAQYANPVALTDKTVLADMTLASFDGYEPATIASWRSPYTDLDGDLVISPSVPSTFSCTGQITVNTVYGSALLDSTGTTLLAAQQYDSAITPITGQAWQVTPEISVSGSINACLC